jgi:hypothetical protein
MTRLLSPCILALALAACASPPPPPPPPVVTLSRAEGVVLTVDVFRLPDGVAWDEVAAYCADGILVPGDIEIRDRRSDSGADGLPCFRIAWANGLPQRWEGCGCDRFGRFELCGVAAARALTGTWVADRSRNKLWRMPANISVAALVEVGWWDDASALAEREWAWSWEAGDSTGADNTLESALRGMPADRQVRLHDALVREALEQSRRAQADGDGKAKHRAAFKLVSLGTRQPEGSSAAAFVRCVRDSGALDAENVTKVLRHLRPKLVAERAYADALAGDPDPVGEYLDLASASDLVTGAAGLVPSALIPAPSTATAAEKWAVKEAVRLQMHETQRHDGLLLYEALVGAGRTADADRLKRELKSRYPVPPIPQGDSEEDVALRRALAGVLPPGDLGSRLRAAEERAKAPGAE